MHMRSKFDEAGIAAQRINAREFPPSQEMAFANPNAAAVIDTLSIVLTNAASLGGSNPMGLDTIVLTR